MLDKLQTLDGLSLVHHNYAYECEHFMHADYNYASLCMSKAVVLADCWHVPTMGFDQPRLNQRVVQ